MDQNRQRRTGASSSAYRGTEPSERAVQNDIRMKHIKTQKHRQRQRKRRRGCLFSVLMLIILIILVFLTPIFNIRYVTIEGNNKVSTEEIASVTGDLRGKNLFKTSLSNVEKAMRSIVYLDDITIKRKYFPPALHIIVSEVYGAACVRIDGEFLVIDADGKILERTEDYSEDYPLLMNYGDFEEKDGNFRIIDDEKRAVASEILGVIQKVGMTAEVDNIDIGDLNNICFRYDDRIDAECGSHIDIERKIRLFKKAVSTSELADNARGTMDLRTSGKSIYSPDIKQDANLTSDTTNEEKDNDSADERKNTPTNSPAPANNKGNSSTKIVTVTTKPEN